MNKKFRYSISLLLCIIYFGCKVPTAIQVSNNQKIPSTFNNITDTSNIASIQWKQLINDAYLNNLIDSAIKNNFELLSTFQDIEIAKNKILFQKGRLMPTVESRLGVGLEKIGRYTSSGAGDAVTEIVPGKLVPDPLSDFLVGFQSNWEIDAFKKIHNAKQLAAAKYLSTIEGKNLLITNLVSEVANSYFELIALDNQLDIINQSILLLQNELEVVKVQKEAAIVSELAVKQFEAQVFKAQSLVYEIQQKIVENENKINFLLGRFPQKVLRNKTSLNNQFITKLEIGLPSQLLNNRPDIKKAELELQAAKFDVSIARAAFYPSLNISANMGLQAFKPTYFFKSLESIIFSFVGDVAAPLINKSAIKADFNTANATQIQAMYDYQKSIVNAFIEVINEINNINNLEKGYQLKSKQVDALQNSIEVSKDLFRSARANYLEILMAQRDALDAKLELIDTKKNQMLSFMNLYKSLGGGWR